MKNKKSLLSLLAVIALLFALPVSASTTNIEKGKKEIVQLDKSIIIVDENSNDIINEVNDILKVDESLQDVESINLESTKQYSAAHLSDKDNSLSIYAYNVNQLHSIDDAFGIIESGVSGYFYGDYELINEILNEYSEIVEKEEDKELVSSELPTRESNLVGFADKKIISENRIQSVDLDGDFITVPSDSFIHSIILDLATKENSSIDQRVVAPLNYGSDTIVWSDYTLSDSFYALNASGQSLLRGKLTTQLILFHNTRSDNDSSYDYFYLRNNAEGTSYNSGKMQNIEVTHDRAYTSDELLDWGPEPTSTSSEITVGLPWSISWGFSAASGNMKIATDGGSTSGSLYWKLFKPGIPPFHNTEYTMPTPSRIHPGTAWASFGSSVAGLNISNTAKFELGTTQYDLSNTKKVRYYY